MVSYVLLLLLLLFAVEGINSVRCTFKPSNPCLCSLSDGYEGIIDFTPIFKRLQNTTIHADGGHVTLHPCTLTGEGYVAAFRPSMLPQTYNYGSVKKAREFYIFDFAVEEDKFKYRLLYRASNDSYSLGIDFTYDPSVPLKVEVPAFDMDEMYANITSQYVKPLLFLESDSVGPYTLEQDVCARWTGQRPILNELGLLNLASPVILLNSTYSSSPPEYHLGVCVNPLKDSDTTDDCFAVQRTAHYSGYEDLCIGRCFQAQLIDQRDQDWMILRYPFGDFHSGCKNYIVTEILFTCDERCDQTTPLLPLYPENSIVYNPYVDSACVYQFIWPTHLACPNVTSPSESPSSSNVSSIFLGMSGSIAVLLLLVLVGVSITSCYFWRRQRTTVVNSKGYQ